MSFDGLLVNTCEVRRTAYTTDEYGIGQASESVIYPALACNIQVLSGTSGRLAEGVRVTASHRLYCALGTELRENDIVRYDDGYAMHVLRVVFIDHNTVGHAHHMEVLLGEPMTSADEGEGS